MGDVINFAHLLGLYFVMEDFIDGDEREENEYGYLDVPEEEESEGEEDSLLLDEETEFHF